MKEEIYCKGYRSMVTNNSKRKMWIDVMKGWIILLVLIVHSGGIPFVGHWLTAYYMQLFFILAGYTLHINNTEGFVKGKAKRLLLPYCFYSVIAVIVVSSEQFLLQTLTVKQFFLNIFGVIYSRYCLFPYGQEDNIYFLK